MLVGALDYGTMAMGLFGGLAIFLFGMEQMTDSLKAVAGGGMKRLLARMTTNRFKAVLAGGTVTAVIQSSSVTTVLTVGFVSAGLMSLEQSIGIIMGAEIGTTVTAQIIAFKVTKVALAIVALGFAIKLFMKSEKAWHIGTMILGLGLIFVGMNLMKDTMGPLKDHQPFLDLMKRMDNPILAILVSAAFTGLVQSSSATTGVILVLASSGFVTLEAGIALVLGANIGTCVTALLASIGRPRVAVQTAMIHVTFNVAGVLLWVGLIPTLAQFMRGVADDLPRQIANSHTVFNTANTFIFIWFTPLFARWVRWLVPIPMEAEDESAPKFLDDNLIETPELAFDRVRLEIDRIALIGLEQARRAPELVLGGSREQLRGLAGRDETIDTLHRAVIRYLGLLLQEGLTEAQTEQMHDAMATVNYLENMADVIETNMVSLGVRRIEEGVEISPETVAMIGEFASAVTDEVARVADAVRNRDEAQARRVIAAKGGLNEIAAKVHGHLTRRLAADEPKRAAAYSIESELVEQIKRVYYNVKRIAKVVVQADMGYQRTSAERLS